MHDIQQLVGYAPIGLIHTPYEDRENSPIQPCYAPHSRGVVEVWPEYAPGLQDLHGYSHIYLIYHFHRSVPGPLVAAPYLQKQKRGLFSTRLPGRPNPIGLSIVELLGVEDNLLHVGGIDVLNGTPLLDIKPYSRRIDCIRNTRNGWQDEVDDSRAWMLGSRISGNNSQNNSKQ